MRTLRTGARAPTTGWLLCLAPSECNAEPRGGACLCLQSLPSGLPFSRSPPLRPHPQCHPCQPLHEEGPWVVPGRPHPSGPYPQHQEGVSAVCPPLDSPFTPSFNRHTFREERVCNCALRVRGEAEAQQVEQVGRCGARAAAQPVLAWLSQARQHLPGRLTRLGPLCSSLVPRRMSCSTHLLCTLGPSCLSPV